MRVRADVNDGDAIQGLDVSCIKARDFFTPCPCVGRQMGVPEQGSAFGGEVEPGLLEEAADVVLCERIPLLLGGLVVPHAQDRQLDARQMDAVSPGVADELLYGFELLVHGLGR